MFEVFAGCDSGEFFLHDGNRGVGPFRSQLGRSVFALCPRGYGRTSFRLYEAMDLGCIPVYICIDGSDLWLPYSDILDWPDFALFIPLDKLEILPDALRGHDDDWVRTAREALEQLRPEFFTMDGMCRQIFRMIGERT